MPEDARLDDFLDDDGDERPEDPAGEQGEESADGEQRTDDSSAADATVDDQSTGNDDRSADSDGQTAPADSDGQPTSDGGRGQSTVDDAAPGAGTEPLEAVAATSRWAADGACPGCGESVARLWRDGDALVCADCKRWRDG